MMHFHVPVTAIYIFMSKCLIEATFMALKFYLSCQLKMFRSRWISCLFSFFFIIIFFYMSKYPHPLLGIYWRLLTYVVDNQK